MFEDARIRITDEELEIIFQGTSGDVAQEVKRKLLSLPPGAVRALYLDGETNLPGMITAQFPPKHTRTIARNYLAFVDFYEKTKTERENRVIALAAIAISALSLLMQFI